MNALIFDFDGVLVDSEQYWPIVENRIFRTLIPGWNEVDHQAIVGMPFTTMYPFLVQKYHMTLSKEEFEVYANEMATEVYNQTQLCDGAKQCMEEAATVCNAIAIATSSRKYWIEPVMKRLGINAICSTIVTSQDILPDRGKPHPDIYILTAKRLNIDPKYCTVIEDSRNGILSAKAAGMKTIGITNGLEHGQDLSQADRTVGSFEEIDISNLVNLGL